MPPAHRGGETPADDISPPTRDLPPQVPPLGRIDPVSTTPVPPTLPGKLGMAARRQILGRQGEDLAAAWYVERGYEVVDRNWRCRDGEIDLIVRKARLFVFCEVKARTTSRFGTPVEAVTRTKRARIRRLAARWLQDSAPVRAREIRFDVASILGDCVEVIEGAF